MRKVGPEVHRSDYARVYSGFYDRYMRGVGLDIGYRGDISDASPVLAGAVGVELGENGYDGIHIKRPDSSVDYVFSSHCLEHLSEPEKNIREWYRLIKLGGFLVLMVPHKYLYEKKESLPSRFKFVV